jgi:hypothetical protein
LTHSAAATIGEIDRPVAKATDGARGTGSSGRTTLRIGLRHFASSPSRFEKLPVQPRRFDLPEQTPAAHATFRPAV